MDNKLDWKKWIPEKQHDCGPFTTGDGSKYSLDHYLAPITKAAEALLPDREGYELHLVGELVKNYERIAYLKNFIEQHQEQEGFINPMLERIEAAAYALEGIVAGFRKEKTVPSKEPEKLESELLYAGV